MPFSLSLCRYTYLRLCTCLQHRPKSVLSYFFFKNKTAKPQKETQEEEEETWIEARTDLLSYPSNVDRQENISSLDSQYRNIRVQYCQDIFG